MFHLHGRLFDLKIIKFSLFNNFFLKTQRAKAQRGKEGKAAGSSHGYGFFRGISGE
jgi:hypothetical protein